MIEVIVGFRDAVFAALVAWTGATDAEPGQAAKDKDPRGRAPTVRHAGACPIHLFDPNPILGLSARARAQSRQRVAGTEITPQPPGEREATPPQPQECRARAWSSLMGDGDWCFLSSVFGSVEDSGEVDRCGWW